MRPGEKPALRYFLFSHIHFDILYNKDRIIEINVSTDPQRTVDISAGEKLIVVRFAGLLVVNGVCKCSWKWIPVALLEMP